MTARKRKSTRHKTVSASKYEADMLEASTKTLGFAAALDRAMDALQISTNYVLADIDLIRTLVARTTPLSAEEQQHINGQLDVREKAMAEAHALLSQERVGRRPTARQQ